MNDFQPKQPPAEPLLTTKQAAVALAVSERTVAALAASGRLPVVRLARKCVRYDVRDIQAMIEKAKESRQTVKATA